MADARAVGGRAHDEVAAEGDPEGGGAVEVEVVQDGGRWEFPARFQRHARQCRVPLAGPSKAMMSKGRVGKWNAKEMISSAYPSKPFIMTRVEGASGKRARSSGSACQWIAVSEPSL